MSGKKARMPHSQPLIFNNEQFTNDHKIAIFFANKFTTAIPHISDPAARCVKLQLLSNHSIDPTLSIFTAEHVVKVIKQCSDSIAAGPDGLMMLHLKHLARRGYEFLTQLFNLYLQSADIPSIWKRATLILIPKPGKLRLLGTS